jgi:outer membrane protein OmpA-like peptidoglycan-associated protein
MRYLTGILAITVFALGVGTASADEGFFTPPHWQNLKDTTAQEGVTREMWERAKHFRNSGDPEHLDFNQNVGINAPHPLFLHPDDRPGPAFEVAEQHSVPKPEEKPVHVGVNFGWDSAMLTTETQVALDRLVNNLPEGATVNVAGHTDTSGPADYNTRLGLERAQNVAAYLTQKGVDVNRVVSYGESRPLVDTGDGVRNADNRRAVITE